MGGDGRREEGRGGEGRGEEGMGGEVTGGCVVESKKILKIDPGPLRSDIG